ncbi:lysophospholipid acyltransferase family protein [bacterium]|nr:lysophospholipid acyltransferase family protein [bacterium]
MRAKKWIYLFLLPKLGWALIYTISKTLRIEIIGQEHLDKICDSKKPISYSIWHGRQFLISYFLADKNTCALTSPSRDGRLQADILKIFGYRIIFGSSKKNPVKALLSLINEIKTNGGPSLIAVDGPRGPIYKVKPGILFLTKKIEGLIVPLTFSVKRGFFFQSWDRYLLPAPFSKAIILIGEPFSPSSKTEKDVIANECAILGKQMQKMTMFSDKMMQKEDKKLLDEFN